MNIYISLAFVFSFRNSFDLPSTQVIVSFVLHFSSPRRYAAKWISSRSIRKVPFKKSVPGHPVPINFPKTQRKSKTPWNRTGLTGHCARGCRRALPMAGDSRGGSGFFNQCRAAWEATARYGNSTFYRIHRIVTRYRILPLPLTWALPLAFLFFISNLSATLCRACHRDLMLHQSFPAQRRKNSSPQTFRTVVRANSGPPAWKKIAWSEGLGDHITDRFGNTIISKCPGLLK